MQYTPEEQTYISQQQGIQQPMMPQQGMPISKDRDFMQWLFNFKEEVVGPLIHIWRGEEETDIGIWKQPKGDNPLVIMNERGIIWCSSFISSFINAVYVVSNYDEENMNATMRRVTHIVWNSLCKRYQEFGLRPIDIPRVAVEIWSKVHAILLGARGDGFRRFFMSTHHIDEVKSTQIGMQQQRQSGWGFFKKKGQVPPINSMEMY